MTGLRILAALAVYASHLGPPHDSPTVLRTFFASGYDGVTLFFVLSGFVLALNYSDDLSRPSARRVWNYVVARFARIYPLYILILAYILIRSHAFGEGISGWWEHVLAIQAWSSNVVQAYSFDGPAWSVSVELFLYACFPVLVVLLMRLRTPRSLMLACAGIVLAMILLTAWFVLTGRGNLPWLDADSAHRWLYRTPATRLGDFMLGILTARIYLQMSGRQAVARFGGPLVIVAGLVMVGLMAWPADLYSAWSWDLLFMLPAALVIFGLAAAPQHRLARMLALPFMILLGESSYAFYLIHQPALEYFGAGRWAYGTSATTIAYEALTLGAIICLAVGLHVTVERPARRYIRRLAGPARTISEQPPWHGPREILP